MTAPLPELHVHVHIEGTLGSDLKETIVATKEEVLASLAELKALALENQEDTARIIAKLDEAIAQGDLTAVATAVEELRAITQATNDAVEAAAPEVAEPEPTPEP